MTQASEKTYLQKIWEKGFLQVILSYLLGAWGLLQFVDWMVNRYGISSEWTDVMLIFLLTLLPSVIVYTYFQNQQKRKTVRLVEKYIIPSNLLLSLLVVFFLLPSGKINASEEKITVVNEDGEKMERFIPKQKFTKKLIFFPSEINNEENDWMRFMIPLLMDADLEQDNRISSISPYLLDDDIKRFGYSPIQKLPFSIQQKIADDNYTDYFITTSINQTADQYELGIQVYSTVDGSLFLEKNYQNDDLYEIVDQFSKDFQASINIDQDNTVKFIDLPSSELFTENLEALKKYALANDAEEFEKDHQKSNQYLEEAIQIDPDFPNAYVTMAGNFQNLGNEKEMKKKLEIAMSQAASLPERMQLNIKYFYYRINENDTEKGIALLEMWTQLYPYDINPYNRLISIHQDRLQFEKAKEVALKALKAGHTGSILLRLGFICRKQGEIAEAEKYYQQFLQEFPHRAEETYSLGWLYQNQGDLAKAKEYFENIQLLNPTDYSIYGPLGEIALDYGELDEALAYFEQGLAKAKIAKDSAIAYNWIESYYSLIGQTNKAIDLMYERFDKLESNYLTPAVYKKELFWASTFYLFSECEREAELRDTCLAYLEQYNVQDESQYCMVEMLSVLFNDDEKFVEIFEKCEDSYAENASQNEIILGKAFTALAKKEYKEAAKLFEIITQDSPDFYFKTRLAEIYIKLEEFEKAKAFMEKLYVDEPNFPRLHLLNAQLLAAFNQKEEALKFLDKALTIWKDADDCFVPAQEAKALKTRLAQAG
ncbi:MAG: tetratricopeptide repeat protein [Saprospiraceae bacterium]|nr:tetratricopeptide repeat protein [Saprospiraceae bacterium]